MPFGDGTGPLGRGPGRGRRGSGDGRGRMPARPAGGGSNRPFSGPGGFCVCPHCGTKVPHERGMPCYAAQCPQCGTKMVRE